MAALTALEEASTLGRPTERKEKQHTQVLGLAPEQNDQELYALFRADSLNRYYIPAVMMGHEQPPPTSNRTLHIMGNDERARFLSHSLHGVYDSVELLRMKQPQPSKYRNISRSGPDKTDGWIEEHAEHQKVDPPREDAGEGHISNLLVTGSPVHTVKLLRSVKHRVDDRTAICYLQDGLGVAEAANNFVFTDANKRPSIVLGHMKTALAKDRNRAAIRSMKHHDFETTLTGVRPYVSEEDGKLEHSYTTTRESTQRLLAKLAQARLLNAQGVPLDNWLALKIPSLMFASIAEPLCVALDFQYYQLVHNPTAQRLVDQLLNEIADVVAQMPEVRRAGPQLQQMLRGESMRKSIFNGIRAKRDMPSKMQMQIDRGRLTEIDFLNGYFIERARRMNIRMPANEMVIAMVKAKHKSNMMRANSYIPFELTSRRT
ncbi:ketopantoate reductase PanE/ApbA C terminal-domain-containing protein [Plectosphaerella cucumerina]|uniref:Ketopantoate reductase PanE/ApbA C terminal-domain-containing protein n=1 Tax=Plectosphaerella cucumerina TaxID=40658 RepID=A0A8K0X1C2_9PEZI|nr:ketopantoate reductase PanE/ApbA C terminal-domain-containing protein [Plectosphaerella cucumerina]